MTPTTHDADIKRRGGSASRRAKRQNALIIHKPTLVRNIPVYEIANKEGVEQVHEFAMRIVVDLGVEFRDAESIEY